MKRAFVLFLWLIMWAPVLLAQERTGFRSVDSATYTLYLNRHWDSLIDVGKKGLRNGIDYYYLRMRMGMARYALNQPAFAAGHFEKALKWAKGDPVAQEYLYGSYLLMNDKSKAALLQSGFPVALKKNIGLKSNILTDVDISSGFKTNSIGREQRSLYLMGNDSLFGTQLLLGKQWYLHAGAGFRFFNRLSLYAAFDRLIINKSTRFQYRESGLKKDSTVKETWGYSNYFSDTVTTKDTLFSDKFYQNNFYLNTTLQFRNGWSAGLFANTLFVKTTRFAAQYDSVQKTDTAYYVEYTGEYSTFDYTEDQYSFSQADTSFINWVAGIFVEKDWNFLKTGLLASAGNLNGYRQLQISGRAVWYPLGNTDFYGISRISLFRQQKPGAIVEQRWLWSQNIGFKLMKKMWIEAGYRQGDFSNTHFEKGFVVYNLPESVNYMAELNFYLFLAKNLDINLRYQYFDLSGRYAYFVKENKSFLYDKFNYKSNNLILEIIWNF